MNILVGIFVGGPSTHNINSIPILAITFLFDGAFQEISRVKVQLLCLRCQVLSLFEEWGTLGNLFSCLVDQEAMGF